MAGRKARSGSEGRRGKDCESVGEVPMENVELIVAHGANGAEEVGDGEEAAGGVEEEAAVGKKRRSEIKIPTGSACGEPQGSWKKVSRPRMAPQAVAAVRWAAEPEEGMERE